MFFLETSLTHIWAHRRRRKRRFFLFERSWAGEWFKILTKVNNSIILVCTPFELAYKKINKYDSKNFGKDKFEKKNWRDSCLGHNKLILRQKTFWLFDLIFIRWYKMSHIYSGRTKYSPCVSKLRKLSKEYLSPQKTQKAAAFFYSKELGLENYLKF